MDAEGQQGPGELLVQKQKELAGKVGGKGVLKSPSNIKFKGSFLSLLHLC